MPLRHEQWCPDHGLSSTSPQCRAGSKEKTQSLFWLLVKHGMASVFSRSLFCGPISKTREGIRSAQVPQANAPWEGHTPPCSLSCLTLSTQIRQ